MQQRQAMGAYIRHQRELANMSLRQLAEATKVSNAYLSQIERGLHDPTMRILLQIGSALEVSLDQMLQEPNPKTAEQRSEAPAVENAIEADLVLTMAEKQALTAIYRVYRGGHVVPGRSD